jgi:hypothetical protein
MRQEDSIDVKKIKSVTAVFLLITMSMVAILTTMPTVLATGEKVKGTITNQAGQPVKDVGIFILEDQRFTYLNETKTDAQGKYEFNLTGPGHYFMSYSNKSMSGQAKTFAVTTGQVLTMDFKIFPDTTDPVITNFQVDVDKGISLNHVSTIDVSVKENWLDEIVLIMLKETGKNGNIANTISVKLYTNKPLYRMGFPVQALTLTDQAGTNSTTVKFDGTTYRAIISDGVSGWPIYYSLPVWTALDTYLVPVEFQNSTIGPNKDEVFLEFNATTLAPRQIDIWNDSTRIFSFNAVNMKNATGKVRAEADIGTFDYQTGQYDSNTVNITPFIKVPDIKPLVLDVQTPSGPHILVARANDAAGHGNSTWKALTVDNTPPVADAGVNITIKQNETALLNGSASTDNMGIVNYTWTYKVGSANYKLFNKTTTTQKIDPIGVYTVTLNVTDTGGWLSTAVTHINVTDGNPPVVDAGKNISVFQTHPFMLNGSLTTDNVDTIQQMNFTWTYNDTVKNITLYGPTPTSSLAKINVYKVKLVVKDRNGNIGGPAYVWVNVTDGFSPVANAGSDITVKQLLKVTFNGSASTDNVGIVNYTWNFTNKGTAVKMYGKAPSFVFDIIGKYNVTLTVKDAAGLTGKDLMVVTVVDGIRPVVKAGTDMVDEVEATFNFNGSGSSDNVGIVKYNWSFGDGTYAQGRIVAHSYGKVGPYKVVLTCTDAQGNSANASLNVTVIPKNNPPTIKTILDQTAIEGVKFTMTLMSTYVSDIDTTDILNFSLTGAPAGMTINSNTGIITWTPATNQDWKSFNVVLFVSDGKAKVNSTFKISVIAKTVAVKIGPIKDKDGNALKDAQVSLMLGADTNSNKTDSKGMTTIFVPGQWASQTVDVKVHKAGYNDKVFKGTIANDGTFTPINGYPKIEAKQTQDYTFLIIVIVVLLVLALVLFSMKRPSEEEGEEEEEEKEGEEALTEEE